MTIPFNRNSIFFLFLLFCGLSPNLSAQDFDLQDTLRGSITPERAWWDLTHYDLHIDVNIEDRILAGHNTISYKVLEAQQVMQIDLQEPMQIDQVEQNGQQVKFKRLGNVFYLKFKEEQKVGDIKQVKITYSGKPTRAVRPPWDGGLTWTTDDNANPFVATSCQGDGASMWWPCKDHMYDEPDSMLMSITVPENLLDVSNGQLREVIEQENGKKTFVWAVVNPINNYGVNINIADYAHFSEVYEGEKGDLDVDYWVLSYNEEKAREQFEQVPMMLKAFEHWFGPYPFYEDGYKLVEVPYLGMEHQSSVTYGNRYMNGYLGNDLSGSGWGKKFDFIIIHESGHEWFANNITYKDIADMWVHEGFTAYSENLYVDYYYGKEASADYVIGTRKNIRNDKPIIGPYDVNQSGSGDMYYKGANMLHTIRELVDDDEKWRSVLRGLNETFYHQTVTTEQIENFIIDKTGLDLQPIFDQYLRTSDIAVLEYSVKRKKIMYRWTNCIESFNMPVVIEHKGERLALNPTTDFQKTKLAEKSMNKWKVDRDYYVDIKRVK